LEPVNVNNCTQENATNTTQEEPGTVPNSTQVDPESTSQPPHSITPRGRKRSRNEDTWKINIKKSSRNSAKPYVTTKGKTVSGKTFTNKPCNCRRKCFERIDENERKQLFLAFWDLKEYSLQNLFIHGSVKSFDIKRKRIRDGSGSSKEKSFQYFFQIKSSNFQVCKQYFHETLQISVGRLYRCLKKTSLNSVVTETRGKGSRKIDDSDVIEHIKSFPAYQSHYTRIHNPERKYLNSDLSIRKMYDLFVEKCTLVKKIPVKEKFFYQVFSSKFNLHFKPPKKDTCRICDGLELKIQAAITTNNVENKEKLTIEKNLHLCKAEKARECLRKDKEKASADVYVATFDLQKALPFPKLATSVAYYKRNMYVYNLGIHNFNSNVGYMNVWNETEGGRGSQDIASSLVKHIKEHAKNSKHVILYSDSCTGQNRNIKMALSLLQLTQDTGTSINTIDHKFLVSGHSFLPNDADFGVIESASQKHTQIFSPENWIEIIKNSKRKHPKFVVQELKHHDFLSTKNLEKNITNRKVTTDGYKFNWLKVVWFRFERSLTHSFKFKENLNDEMPFYEVDLTKKGRGRPVQWNTIVQDPLYICRRVVTDIKKKIC
jgi:hypothetical protein